MEITAPALFLIVVLAVLTARLATGLLVAAAMLFVSLLAIALFAMLFGTPVWLFFRSLRARFARKEAA